MFLLKLWVGIASVGAIAYLSICVFLRLRQAHFMFSPTQTIEATPAAFNLPYENVWIPVSTPGKTEKMHGWWIPAASERGVVLHLHGNSYNIGANLGQALRFHQLAYSVLLVDYRGYGQSEGGFPSEASLYQDAEAMWDHLVRGRRVAPKRVFLFGHSLGGAIAVDLALRHPEAAGLIVQSSFTSMAEMVKRRGYGIFPIDLLLTQRFETLQKVRSLRLPVLYIHGTADRLIPVAMGDRLFATSATPKRLYLVESAGHNDVAEVGGDRYGQVVQQFLSQPQVQPAD